VTSAKPNDSNWNSFVGPLGRNAGYLHVTRETPDEREVEDQYDQRPLTDPSEMKTPPALRPNS
jgi:hypothetical protein